MLRSDLPSQPHRRLQFGVGFLNGCTARVWISSGTYEGAIHRDALTLDRLFTAAGARVATSVVHQGHSFGAWRESVVGMLEYLLRP